MCRAESLLVSQMNGLFKTIFQVKLSYWLKALYSQIPEQCICRTESSPLLPMKSLFKIISQVKLSYWLKDLSPKRPGQWISKIFPSVTNEWPFQDYLLSKSIISPEWICRVFPSFTGKQPFQDHLPSETIILAKSSVFWKAWVNMQSKVFSSVTDEWLFPDHVLSKPSAVTEALSPRRPKQCTCRGFHSVTNEWPSQYNLPNQTIISIQNSVSQEKTWTMNVQSLVFPSVTDKQPF